MRARSRPGSVLPSIFEVLMSSSGASLPKRAVALLSAAMVCLLASLVSVTAAATAPTFTSSHGLRVQGVRQIDARLFDVTLTSTAVSGLLHVRVLLPTGYDAKPQRRYPVLYLFHGTSGGASDWTDRGHAEEITAGRNFITVMPDAAVNYSGGG
jgi:S-formylglutathione hydrolase FrmB